MPKRKMKKAAPKPVETKAHKRKKPRKANVRKAY